jgi:hypothetical protein
LEAQDMSLEAYRWVEKQSPQVKSGKLVLYGLAGFADAKGYCFPRQESLADVTGLCVRTVMRALAGLEAEGFLSRKCSWRKHGRGSDRYQLHLTANLTNCHLINLTNLPGIICHSG